MASRRGRRRQPLFWNEADDGLGPVPGAHAATHPSGGSDPISSIDHGSQLTGLGDDDHALYHTDARALTWLGTRSTTDLSEGTNLYWTDARWQTAWGLKSTTNLPEGASLYYTDVRVDARIALANWEDLADVVAYSTLADGEIPVWNTAAGGWRHRTLAEAGVSATGHVHAAGDITSDTFADALVAESNVTQHEAALSIGAAQITAGVFPAGAWSVATNSSFNIIGTSDAGIGGVSGILNLGDTSGAHLSLDANEILAKADATTATILYIQNDGGSVRIGRAVSLFFEVNTDGLKVSSANVVTMSGTLDVTGAVTVGSINEAAVTAHEAALSIGAGQVVSGTFPGVYTFTGLVKCVNHIAKSSASSFLTLSGGSTKDLGANILLNGESAAGAKDMNFRSSGVTKFWWDDSASLWTFTAPVNFDAAVTMDTTLGVTGLATLDNSELRVGFSRAIDVTTSIAMNASRAVFRYNGPRRAIEMHAGSGKDVSFDINEAQVGYFDSTDSSFKALFGVDVTGTLAVTGVATFSERVKLRAGSSGNPGFDFTGATGHGAYWSGTEIVFQSGGSGDSFKISGSLITCIRAVSMSSTLAVTGAITMSNALNHDGTTAGFFNTAPVTQRSDIGALTLTTHSGTPDTVLTDVTDAASIDDNFHEVGLQINAIRTALRDLGLMA